MAFDIIDNIEIPATVAARTRSKGEFATALDKLEIGQGFIFSSTGALKAQYPKVAPKKFPGKKFKVWAVDGQEDKFGVKRVAVAEA